MYLIFHLVTLVLIIMNHLLLLRDSVLPDPALARLTFMYPPKARGEYTTKDLALGT